MEVKGKIALVTGASKGIGASIAEILAKHGVTVIINFNSDETSAKQVLKDCNKNSKNNTICKADITKENEIKEMFNLIKEKFGRLDILVNNAGIFDESDTNTNIEVFEKIFQVNFLAHVKVIKHALGLMKSGKIINVSSTAGRVDMGKSYRSAYSSMKAALDNYTLTLAKELAPKILVNSIAPGKTMTPMWGKLEENEEKELSKTHLINRFIQPKEVAEGILFLIKNDAMCGEILTIDGGMSIKH